MPDALTDPSPPPPHRSSGAIRFIEPNWRAPLLEVDCVVPKDYQVAGMFFLALQAKAQQMNLALPGARPRYVPFNFYPLSELAPLMLAAAKNFYPGKSPREGMRTMGRAVPKALIASTIGKVVFGSVEGVHAAAEAMAKAYGINLRPSRVQVIESAPSWMIVRLEAVHHFLDSHHVGIFEGVMLHAGVKGEVRVAATSASAAEFLLTW